MRRHEPACKIPYLTLVSEILRDFRELHSPLDIFDRVGKECLMDITDIPRDSTMPLVTSWPEGSEKKVFQFKESNKRWGILDFIFYEGRLVNFCAQIFFQGWFATSKTAQFNSLKLRPLINEINGTGNVHPDFFNNTCSCSDGDGLIIAFHYVNKTTSIATTIAEETFA